jgi:hypothetical protein
MADTKPQNFSNHRRFVPLYHFVLSLILLINLVWTGWGFFKSPSGGALVGLVLAVGLLLLFYYARGFALAVQDRLIRLEERLRMQEVLPDDLKGRIMELSPGHLIGLRFAPDEELPGLVREVLDGKLEGREAIKKKVKSWRADHYRA